MLQSVIPVILSELQKQYGITYEDAIQLQDENGNSHNFYVASMYNAQILVDTNGQLWMNEAEIGRVASVAEGTIHNALSRFLDTSMGQAISQLYNLYSTDQRGRKRLMGFHNEAVVAAVITGLRNPSDQAITFIQEREAIISGIRKLMHDYSMYTNDQNFQLAAKLENLSAALSNEQREKRQLEWRLEEYELEQERKNRDNLDLYDYNDL